MNIDNILERLPNSKPTSNGWQAQCPAHDDSKASLCIHRAPDGKILLKCQAGCETKDIIAKLGLSWSDLFSPKTSEAHARVPTGKDKYKRRSLRIEKKVIATYDYLNENSELLYQVQRTENKQFIQRRRVVRDNVAKWVYDMKGVTRVLYRLPSIKAAVDEGKLIYVVEGEKDVHTLESWGLVGTTNSGGAMAKWLDSFSAVLAGADVIVIPDNDTPGRKHVESVARSLINVASRVRAVVLPGLKEHGDFTDWVEAGGTQERLNALIAEAPAFEPESIHKEYKTPQGISRIGMNNIPLREIGRAAISAIVTANRPPCLFLKGGAIVRYRETELSQPLIERVNEAIIGSRLADVADFVFETRELEKQMNPPKDVIRYVMSDASLPLPKLVGVTESPMLRPDGSILSQPGYDEATGYYYRPPDGFMMPEVPEHPTDEQLSDAVDLVTEAICDFPFVDEASRTNTVALMLTPLVRNIMPTVPIALVDATNQGTGKTLLSEVCATVSCGSYELGTVPADSEEWRKRITSLLSEGTRFVILDNVRGTLGSDSLASVLTTARWSDRRLGTLETASYPNNCTWVATGNNLQTDRDMSRRGYLIELDAKCARPYARSYEFKHPELLEWVNLCRGELLAALFTLIRAWYSTGQPIAALPPVGSFEAWSRVVGSIVTHVGLRDFNGNRDKLLNESDTESSQWESFLSRWIELYGESPRTVSQMKEDLISSTGFEGVLPEVVSYAVKGGSINPNKVGRAFRAREGTRFGEDGLYLCRAGDYQRAVLWQVKRSSGASAHKFGEFCEFGESVPPHDMHAHDVHDDSTCSCTPGKEAHNTHKTHKHGVAESQSSEDGVLGYEEF
ncbi:MAG: hypothetical protein ACYC64_10365 [Armatimonadota bacterium]